MILRELREIDQSTDDILVYGYDPINLVNTKIITNPAGKLDIVNVNLDIALSDLKAVLDAINADLDVALSTRASESTLALIKTSIDNINSNIDVALSTRASEGTSQSILNALGEQSGTDILTELQNLLTNTTGLATEATLSLVKTAIESIDSSFDVALSTRASESTLGSVLIELQSIDAKDFATETTQVLIKTAIDSIDADIDVALSTRASEATQALIKIAIDAINSDIDVSLSTRASELTVQSILDSLGTSSGTDLLNELQNLVINTTDIATETTLALIKIAIDSINTDIDVALSTRASEVTLLAIKTAVESIDTDLDVALSTRSSEATLLLVKTNLDDIKTKLDTLNATDFATESTQTEILDTIGQESGATVLSKLDQIDDTLNEFLTPFPGLLFSKFLENGGSKDLNVDGSVTPVDFTASPPIGKIWYIHSLTIVIEDSSMNFNKYGGISALTSGIDFKVKQNGLPEIISGNIKRNGDYYTFINTLIFESSGTDLLVGKILFKETTGTTIKLVNSNSDYVRATINDNLTGLTNHFVLIRGYEVDE